MLSLAKWITAPKHTKEAADGFTKNFSKKGEVKSATLYVTALGIYAPYLNGERVHSSVLMPGWTSYRTRIQYQAYDVTHLIKEENEIYISVGQGWALSNIGLDKNVVN